MSIGFYFSGSGGKLQLPVNPAELAVQYQGNNQRTEVIALGEINILRSAKLAALSLEFLLPGADYYPFIVGVWQPPEQIVCYFRRAMEKRKALRLVVTDIGFNMRLSVESITPTQCAGDHESVMCSLSLLQYRSYGASTVSVVMPGSNASAQKPERPVEKPETETYTVKSGDSFWAIAQRTLGNGSRYAELAKFNGMAATGVIHPGDVLRIPSR